MKKKILHGMVDVAGQGSYAVLGLLENKEDAELVVWEKNKIGYTACADCKCLNISRKPILYPISFLKTFFFTCKAVHKYDVFHFHFCRSLMPFNLDLPILRILGKKALMEYHGSDIRWHFYREMPEVWCEDRLPSCGRRSQRANKFIDKYIDGYILHDSELFKHLPQTDKPVYYIPLKVNVDNFTPSYPDVHKKKPIIVHAPSNNLVKGSKYVLEAVERLKSKYDFEFVLVQGKPQSEALKIYQTADIILDQFIIGAYGVFAVEAMAMGKPVLCYLTEEMVNSFPDEIPIVNANIHNLADRLECLILDAELRNSLGRQGRIYAENYHDYKYIAKALSQVYDGTYTPRTAKEAFQYIKHLKEAGSIGQQ